MTAQPAGIKLHAELVSLLGWAVLQWAQVGMRLTMCLCCQLGTNSARFLDILTPLPILSGSASRTSWTPPHLRPCSHVAPSVSLAHSNPTDLSSQLWYQVAAYTWYPAVAPIAGMAVLTAVLAGGAAGGVAACHDLLLVATLPLHIQWVMGIFGACKEGVNNFYLPCHQRSGATNGQNSGVHNLAYGGKDWEQKRQKL